MSEQANLVSVGYIAQRWDVDPREVLAKLAELGFAPRLSINGLKLFDADEATRAAARTKCPASFDALDRGVEILHGPPCGPVEIHDDDADDARDDDEPEAPGDIPPSLIRSSDINELTGRN